MHNCFFLTILNELIFLLYPLDTLCVLNLALKSVFFLCSMNVVLLRYITGPLAVIYLIKNELPHVDDAVQCLCLSSLQKTQYCLSTEESSGGRSIVRKLCERRK